MVCRTFKNIIKITAANNGVKNVINYNLVYLYIIYYVYFMVKLGIYARPIIMLRVINDS